MYPLLEQQYFPMQIQDVWYDLMQIIFVSTPMNVIIGRNTRKMHAHPVWYK